MYEQFQSHGKFWPTLWILPKFNSIAPGRCGCNFDCMISKQSLVTDTQIVSSETALKWMPQDITDDESTLVQLMAWRHHNRVMTSQLIIPVTNKENIKALHLQALCEGNPTLRGGFFHKGPIMLKMFHCKDAFVYHVYVYIYWYIIYILHTTVKCHYNMILHSVL